MKRNGLGLVGLVAALVVGAFGCLNSTPEKPLDLEKVARPGGKDRIASAVTMSPGVWAIRKSTCQDCHTNTYNGNYTAGINMLTKTSLTSAQMQTFYDAISYEKAPAGYHITSEAERETLLTWAYERGASAYDLYIPSTLYWSQATQMSGASNGSDAQAAGRFYGFSIEDLYRPTMWIENYTSASAQNLTKNCVTLQDFHTVSQDSFSQSEHPVNYILPDGVSFNGRVKEFSAAGWVVQDRHMGIFFHSRLLKKGPSTTGARDDRTYVRLQVDQDYFALHGKLASQPDDTETFPAWNGAEPLLTAQPGFQIGTKRDLRKTTPPDTLMYLNNDIYYYVELVASIVSGKMRYHAKLLTGPGGTLISEIGAERDDDDEAYGGFGFFTYTQNGANKKDRWAEWIFSASSMHGQGGLGSPNGTGCRPPCELDRPGFE